MQNKISWIACSRKPDSDVTVMLFNADADEPVWLGYLDGEQWRYCDGVPAMPSHWAALPEGPQA
jgi:hypothetical protein